MVPSEQATPKIPMAKGGMSALHYAARQGSLESVRVLASARGIDMNKVDPDGINALLYATLNGHFDVAALLLEMGADPNVADQYGRTMLFAAIDLNRPEFEPRPYVRRATAITPIGLSKLALSKGANPDLAIKGRIPNRCPLGCRAPGIDGSTPLWRAAKSRDAQAVALLLASGAKSDLAATDGSTPFHMAAGMSWQDGRVTLPESEAIEVLKQLLAAGVPINATNAAGETALHAAASRGGDDVIRFLVEAGADLSAKDKANRTPLHVALGIAVPQVRQGGGAATNATVREQTAALLRQLMSARGVPAEPYARPTAQAAP
jgi:ankyrin repeat protein